MSQLVGLFWLLTDSVFSFEIYAKDAAVLSLQNPKSGVLRLGPGSHSSSSEDTNGQVNCCLR